MTPLSLNREQTALAVATGLSLASIALMRLDWVRILSAVFSQIHWGRNRHSDVVIDGVPLSDDARVRHTHIVGATGSGKTVLIEQLLLSDLQSGRGCLIIDPKGDRELYERVRSECIALGREKDLHLLSATFPEESVVWNPCGLGNVSELQSKFFNSAIYAEPHYAKWSEKALLQAFNRLVPASPSGFTLTEVVQELERFCAEMKSKNEKIEGLFLDFYNLAFGEWGSLLGVSAEGVDRPSLSLLDLTQRNQILFVDLPTEAKKVQSARIGRLLTQELMLISGLRKIYPDIRSDRPFSVYIDEFDAFATESFATFLNKARSSGFMIHIAHQTLSDLNRVSQDFAGQILGNCNIRFIFRQDDPDDAERWSRFIGTRSTIKRTYQTENGTTTGRSSNREVQEFVVAPDVIKSLSVGAAILSVKTDKVHRLIRTKLKKAPASVSTNDSHRRPESRGLGTTAEADRDSGTDISPEHFGLPSAPGEPDAWGAMTLKEGEER